MIFETVVSTLSPAGTLLVGDSGEVATFTLGPG